MSVRPQEQRRAKTARAEVRQRKKARLPISKEPVVMGRVVAERRYQVGDESVLVHVGTPHRASWGSDFYCTFRLVGRTTTLHRTFGVDALQALQLAFVILRARLKALSPPPLWDGAGFPGDVGIQPFTALFLGDAKSERRMERAIARLVRDQGRKPKAQKARHPRLTRPSPSSRT